MSDSRSVHAALDQLAQAVNRLAQVLQDAGVLEEGAGSGADIEPPVPTTESSASSPTGAGETDTAALAAPAADAAPPEPDAAPIQFVAASAPVTARHGTWVWTWGKVDVGSKGAEDAASLDSATKDDASRGVADDK